MLNNRKITGIKKENQVLFLFAYFIKKSAKLNLIIHVGFFCKEMAKFIAYHYGNGDQSCSLVADGSVTRGGGTMPIFDGGLAGSSIL